MPEDAYERGKSRVEQRFRFRSRLLTCYASCPSNFQLQSLGRCFRSWIACGLDIEKFGWAGCVGATAWTKWAMEMCCRPTRSSFSLFG